MSIAKILQAIHPDAYILSVEVDEHEHRDNCRCEITGKRIIPWDGEEWPVISRVCIREALDMLRDRVKAKPVTDATVSARAAELRAIDEAFDGLARAS